MNKRIADLFAQALDEAVPETWTTLNPVQLMRLRDKFAELIVRECLDVVALRLYLGTEEICRQECKAVASEIKEYFGVE